MDRDYRIVDCGTHFDVYIYGKLYCSADSFESAVREAERYFRVKDWAEETSEKAKS